LHQEGAPVNVGGTGVSLIAVKDERARTGFGQAESAANISVDGEIPAVDGNLAIGGQRNRRCAQGDVIRAGKGKVSAKRQGVINGEWRAAGVVKRSAIEIEGAGTEGGRVVEVESAAGQRYTAGSGGVITEQG